MNIYTPFVWPTYSLLEWKRAKEYSFDDDLHLMSLSDSYLDSYLIFHGRYIKQINIYVR